SEHYNLSTALRQPVADAVTVSVPYGALALLGFRPDVIETARGINLLYQYWIHTEVIAKLPRFEKVFNSPSLHRVHHGSNQKYLDRNHGSILIIWDRLFGTYQEEDEPVVYGLTRNIETFNPVVVAGHEWRDIARDVARSRTWSDRLGFALRGPGWAYRRRDELDGGPVSPPRGPSVPAASAA
ncbi:MAG: sterol desaturase family protein, partial [Acidimicrobiales bacterium]|nr:sterol desaturase family protein [Acidimicrobiales bacterium]